MSSVTASSAPTAEPVVAPSRPDTDRDTIPRPVPDDGDHDRFAHYVNKADAARSYVEGTPVRALCGKVWVPSRDPDRYPVCPTCKEIVDAVFGSDDGDGGGDAEG